jgi:hypothetical protein
MHARNGREEPEMKSAYLHGLVGLFLGGVGKKFSKGRKRRSEASELVNYSMHLVVLCLTFALSSLPESGKLIVLRFQAFPVSNWSKFRGKIKLRL